MSEIIDDRGRGFLIEIGVQLSRLRADLAKAEAERDALAAEVAALKAAANPLARRKVVQLIVRPQEGQDWNELYAVCDDGTIWQRYEPHEWSQVKGIPQPEQEVQP